MVSTSFIACFALTLIVCTVHKCIRSRVLQIYRYVALLICKDIIIQRPQEIFQEQALRIVHSIHAKVLMLISLEQHCLPFYKNRSLCFTTSTRNKTFSSNQFTCCLAQHSSPVLHTLT